MLSGFLAVLISLVGTGILFFFWRRKYPLHGVAIISGWALLLASSVFWVASTGVEFGVVFSLIMPSLYAWVFIVAFSEVKSTGRSRPKPYQVLRPSYTQFLRNGGLLLLVIVLLAISSTFITLALTSALPIQEIDRLAVGALLLPVVWGGAIVWVLIDGRKFRPLIANGVSGLFSVVYIFYGVTEKL